MNPDSKTTDSSSAKPSKLETILFLNSASFESKRALVRAQSEFEHGLIDGLLDTEVKRIIPEYCSTPEDLYSHAEAVMNQGFADHIDAKLCAVIPLTNESSGDGVVEVYEQLKNRSIPTVLVGNTDDIVDGKFRKDIFQQMQQNIMETAQGTQKFYAASDYSAVGKVIRNAHIFESNQDVLRKADRDKSSGVDTAGSSEGHASKSTGQLPSADRKNALLCGFASEDLQHPFNEQVDVLLAGFDVYATNADLGVAVSNPDFRVWLNNRAAEIGGFDRIVLGTDVIGEEGITTMQNLYEVITVLRATQNDETEKMWALYDLTDHLDSVTDLLEEGIGGSGNDFEILSDLVRCLGEDAKKRMEIAKDVGMMIYPATVEEFNIDPKYLVEVKGSVLDDISDESPSDTPAEGITLTSEGVGDDVGFDEFMDFVGDALGVERGDAYDIPKVPVSSFSGAAVDEPLLSYYKD